MLVRVDIGNDFKMLPSWWIVQWTCHDHDDFLELREWIWDSHINVCVSHTTYMKMFSGFSEEELRNFEWFDSFIFENAEDLMLFKLAWGGRGEHAFTYKSVGELKQRMLAHD